MHIKAFTISLNLQKRFAIAILFHALETSTGVTFNLILTNHFSPVNLFFPDTHHL